MEAQRRIPEARVVVGKRAPQWTQESPKLAGKVSYERAAVSSHRQALAVLNAFWPLMIILTMGIALLWSGSLANSP